MTKLNKLPSLVFARLFGLLSTIIAALGAFFTGEKYYIGIDVGGSWIKFSALLGKNEIQAGHGFKIRTPETAKETVEVIRDGLPEFIAQLGIDASKVKAVGVDLPMGVSHEGVPGKPPNLCKGWEGFKLKEELEKVLGLQVAVINDGNALALAECHRLYPKLEDRLRKVLVALSPGTGLAGGIVTYGHSLTGEDGYGGEVGHQTFDPRLVPDLIDFFGADDIPCGCGAKGCVEPWVSRQASIAIADYWHTSGCLPGDHPLRAYKNHKEWADHMLDLADNGDEWCRNAFLMQAKALGVTFGSLINVINPSCLVLGGGMASKSDEFKKAYVEALIEGMVIKGMGYIAAKYLKSRIVFSNKDNAAFGAALYVQDVLVAA